VLQNTAAGANADAERWVRTARADCPRRERAALHGAV